MNAPTRNNQQKPWLAVLFSLLTTGLGQVYNGQWQKGLLFFLAESLLGLGAMLAMGTFYGLICGLSLLLIVHLFAATEAYRAARHMRTRPLGVVNRWWVYCVIIMASTAVGAATEVFISSNYYETFKVPSGSMLQTLQISDHFMAIRLHPNESVRRGDIMVFKPDDSDFHFVKRVIALPGERIAIKDKQVLLNGKILIEPYVQHTKPKTRPVRDIMPPLTLGPDEYFLMGDNREASHDSRWFGPVHRRHLKARAAYIYFPGKFTAPNWSARLGKPLRYSVQP